MPDFLPHSPHGRMKSILSDEFLHAHSNPVSAMGTLTSAFESTKIEAEPLSPEQVQRRTKKGLKLKLGDRKDEEEAGEIVDHKSYQGY